MNPTAHTHGCPPIRRYIFQNQTLAVLESWFAQAGHQSIEDVAVGAGYPTVDGDAIVAAVLHPNAERGPGWYEQRDDVSWDELYAFGHRYSMYYLLQLHTHPMGCGTRHSPRDDVGAFSDRLGFLSIVVPDFGIHGVNLLDPRVTVHERSPRGWRVWAHDEVVERLIVVPGSVDLQDEGRKQRP